MSCWSSVIGVGAGVSASAGAVGTDAGRVPLLLYESDCADQKELDMVRLPAELLLMLVQLPGHASVLVLVWLQAELLLVELCNVQVLA